jgi:hypothetical protein
VGVQQQGQPTVLTYIEDKIFVWQFRISGRIKMEIIVEPTATPVKFD